ncbi:MAG: alpha/beta hydrolase-fold protein, partial [Bacteroidota bacterium]
QVDETADSLIRAGTLKSFIIVAVSNTSDRSTEYSYGSKAELYAQYLIEQVLPYVRERYPIAEGPENTAVMGSSMGGLSSFVLAWEHPEVFGKAACLSPAFKLEEYDYVSKAAKMKQPVPLPSFYIDNGTEDLEARLQAGIDDMKAYLTQENIPFTWYLAEGAKHNEGAWADRLDIPLRWLFGLEN